MKCHKRVENIFVEVGGEPHSGWLPEHAAIPNQTPVKHYTVTIEILSDGDADCILCYHSTDNEYKGDFWFENIARAEAAALDWFGVKATDWKI